MLRNKPFDIFTLQWHITNNCEMRCKHCYVDFSTNASITAKDFRKGLNNYIEFLQYHQIKGKIYFTGGDPLLHPKIWEFVKIINENGIKIAFLGNFHLLSDDNIRKLKQYNTIFYQLSVEGLEKRHNAIRGEGTFQKVIYAIDRLEEAGIYTIVNLTLSEMNKNDLVPLIRYLAYNTKLSRFDFVRIVPLGRVTSDLIVPNNELRNIFLDVLGIEQELLKDNKKLVLGKKDHLRKALYSEYGKLRIDYENQAYGCGMGYRHLTILENGNVLLCRKIPIIIGNIFKDSLIDIYNNPSITSILKNEYIKGCKGCKLGLICRGCPAVTYGLNHDFKKKDPQCRL